MTPRLQVVTKSEPKARFELVCDDCGWARETEEVTVCLMMVNPQHRWPKCRQCRTTLTLMQVY